MLAARLMTQPEITVLITGNKKDFPECVFDVVAVLNIEQKRDGVMRAFSVVQFNVDKFNACYKNLLTLEAKLRKQL